MSNKVSAIMDKLETAYNTLVLANGSGTLKAVRRAVVLPETVVNFPELGLAVARIARANQFWTADVAITAVAAKANSKPDEKALDLVAALDGVVTTMIEAGNSGGLIDRPTWDFWYEARNDHSGLQMVVILGQTKITVKDPLLL